MRVRAAPPVQDGTGGQREVRPHRRAAAVADSARPVTRAAWAGANGTSSTAATMATARRRATRYSAAVRWGRRYG